MVLYNQLPEQVGMGIFIRMGVRRGGRVLR